jgi:hypothetical protein
LISEFSANIAFLVLAIGLAPSAYADDHRASVNYMIHCQGCHLPDAVGFADQVPGMKDFVGYFAHSPEGRDFLIRVPGVATASLPDEQLSELMNWLLLTYSADQLPNNFAPYSRSEVAILRTDLEANPEKTRKRILEEIAQKVPALAGELREQDGN